MKGYFGYSLLWLLGFALSTLLGLMLTAFLAVLISGWRWAAMADSAQLLWSLFGGLLFVLLPVLFLRWVIRLEVLIQGGGELFLTLLENEVRDRGTTEVPSEKIRAAYAFIRRLTYSFIIVGIVLWGLLSGFLVGVGVALTGESLWSLAYAVGILALIWGFRRLVGFFKSRLSRRETRGALGTVWGLRELLGH